MIKLIVLLTTSLLVACTQCQSFETDGTQNVTNESQAEEKPTSDAKKVEITEIEKGTGDPLETGKTVVVHYVGTLVDGQKFDSSRDRGQAFEFTFGSDQVIAGWNEGMRGMRVGGKRRILIPQSQAYGERGVPGVIPPEADLIFEVEVLQVK